MLAASKVNVLFEVSRMHF